MTIRTKTLLAALAAPLIGFAMFGLPVPAHADEAVSVQEDDVIAASSASSEQLKGDYNIATDSYANSWRFEQGVPVDQLMAPYELRAAGNTWSYKDGVWYCSNGTSVSGAKGMGVDVSQWQGAIDWGKVKSSGVSYAIIRCGYGGDNRAQDDKMFVKNVRACLNNGIPFGIYLYSYAWNTGDAQDEANHVLRLLRENGIDSSKLSFPIYYDLEEQAGTGRPCVNDNGTLRYMSNDDLAAMATTFCTAIESAGYQAGVYANLYWWNNFLTHPAFNQWSRWVAQYNYQCDYQGSYDIWQRMSTGSIPGVSGNVDINFSYVDPTNLYPEQKTWARLYGQDQFDTMQALAKAGWTTSDAVVIATDATYWDALAASSLAGAYNCPILLTQNGSLSRQAEAEIKRLGAKTAYICGGPIAIASNVDGQVQAAGAKPVRVYGQDQQGTARAIARQVKQVGASDICIIATSWKFQDALSISPYAYAKRAPIFLCESGSNSLSRATLDAIQSGGYKRAIIVGGPIAVDAGVDGQLRSIGVSPERKYGQTEYETSLAIAEWELTQGMKVEKMAVATGVTYYDALAGAALCGRDNSVLVIVADYNRTCLTNFVAKHRGEVTTGRVFGGEIAVSASTWNALLRSYFG